MSKRRLSKRQHQRITERQRQSQGSNTGLVIAHFGKEVDIASIDDKEQVELAHNYRCHFRANLPTIVCGDKVRFTPPEETGKTGIVESILPRQSLIERPRPYQPPKPVAANIDTIVLVLAVEPEPIANLADRYLIAAENARLDILILVNKSDQLDKPELAERRGEIDSLLSLYQQLGYRCFYGSAEKNQLCERGNQSRQSQLSSLFENRCSILVGQSGVGKSSIINTITSAGSAIVGEVSTANIKGRHTTTTSCMYFLDEQRKQASGNTVIDSPGIREFGLWHLDKSQIIDGMPELRELALQCRFRDCDHEHSNGCAIQQAIAGNEIDSRRLASYRQILDTMQQFE